MYQDLGLKTHLQLQMHCLILCKRLQAGCISAIPRTCLVWCAVSVAFILALLPLSLTGMVVTFCPAVHSDFVVTTLSTLLCCYFSLSDPVSDSLLPYCCFLSGRHGCCLRPTLALAGPPAIFLHSSSLLLVSVLEQINGN